jgi:hypothetical protein
VNALPLTIGPAAVLALRCDLSDQAADQAPYPTHRLSAPFPALHRAHPSTKLLWLHAGDDTGPGEAELAGTYAKGRRTR